ncbi:MAG TPA: ERCC4 domain-containing protein [Vicinamibacteria bacterium]|jgi:Fanconi anemia group M protein
MSRIEILADHREGSSDLHRLLAVNPEVLLVEATLSSADYSIGRHTGVERKTAEDFARSLIDGRLFPQTSALRRRYRRPLMVLEALPPLRAVQGVSAAALRGALLSVTAVFGVPVVYSSGPEETADLIVAIGRLSQRPFSDGYVRPGYRPRGWRKRALYILQGLPGVGPCRSARLLSEFGSVEAVVAADASRLAQVVGVGRGIARRIRWAVGPEPDCPGLAARPVAAPRRIT